MKSIFKILVSIITGLFLLLPAPAFSSDVAVIADMNVKPLNETVDGIHEVLGAQVFEKRKDIKGKYKVIVALGSEPLNDAKSLAGRDTYIIYSYVANPFDIGPVPNSTGITLFAQFEESLKTLIEIAPSVKRIGVVYNHASSLYMMQELKGSVSRLGLTWIVRAAENPSDAIKKVQAIEKDVDAFMLMPDATIYTSQVVDYIILSGFRNKVPVVGFAGRHIKRGALVAYTFDTYHLGRQIGRIAQNILDGGKAQFLYPPDNLSLEINLNTMEILNLRPPKNILDSARGYRP